MKAVWQELSAFFSLYVDYDHSLDNFGVMMLIMFANIALYLLDFYSLTKVKSTAETLAVLIIPAIGAAWWSVMAALTIYVPKPGELGVFYEALQSPGLNAALSLMVVAYLIVWLLNSRWQRKRRKHDSILWILSCMPDYFFAAVILTGVGFRLVQGKDSAFDRFEWGLWFYLYAVYLLACKIVILTAGILLRLYSTRIRFFRWREGKRPSAFLKRYFILYQNSVFRNMGLYVTGSFALFTWILIREWSMEMAVMIFSLYGAMVFVMIFSLKPAMNGLGRFKRWDAGKVTAEELFCREYFTEEPIYRDANYTVTRHFLVDEQNTATVFYWPALSQITGLCPEKGGNNRYLVFSDGCRCKITEEESRELAPLFSYASQWLCTDGEAWEKRDTKGRKDSYETLLRNLAIIIFWIFMILGLFSRGAPPY